MIKNNKYLLLLSFLISLSAFGQLDQFKYSRPLSGVNDQWHRIELPSDIFQKLNTSMSDIRVYGITEKNDTIEAPYLLEFNQAQNSKKKIAFKVINESKNTAGYFYSFDIPSAESINQIDLDFRLTNFDWKIKLEGSHDQNEWFTILNDYRILSIKNNATDYQFTRLNFPKSKYKYYRLLVPSKEKPEFKSAEIDLNETLDGKYHEYDNLVIKKDQEKATKNTVINVKFREPVFVNQITIPVEDNFDYYRTFSIKQITDSVKTEKGWKYNYRNLKASVLSSLEDHVFSFNGQVLDQLQITIYNQDNEPLSIGQIKARGYIHELHVRMTKPASYFLAYGKEKIRRPSYDLGQFKSGIPDNLGTLILGTETTHEVKADTVVEPLFKNKTWLWVIMGAIILLLGWFTIGMISKK